ncbi:MAG: hypothetical protein U1D30_03045 [Planctomycetota bacterium]
MDTGSKVMDDTRQMGGLSGNRRRGIRMLALGVLTMATMISLEVVCRAYWSISKRVPFFNTSDLWIAFHPEVVQSGVLTADFSNHDATYDVLLLGGSVLTDEFGCIGEQLRRQLEASHGKTVRIFNLAASAKTSKDSLLKYLRVKDKPFDLVLVYDSVNDVRMNNCPPSAFQKDYSHCAWYRQLDMAAEHPELSATVLPYTCRYLWVEGLAKLGFYIPRHRPDDRHLGKGAGTATTESLHDNLESLLRISRERKQSVILASFAIHVPPNYSLSSFQNKQLDYGEHRSPIEIWGTPEQVAECMAAHDAVIKSLSEQFDHVVFVDQAALMPRGKRYFNDICHLTNEGCERFARHIVDALASRDESVKMSRSTRTPSLMRQSN